MADDAVYANEIITDCCFPRLQCLRPKSVFSALCDSHWRYYIKPSQQKRSNKRDSGCACAIIIIGRGGVLRDTENWDIFIIKLISWQRCMIYSGIWLLIDISFRLKINFVSGGNYLYLPIDQLCGTGQNDFS